MAFMPWLGSSTSDSATGAAVAIAVDGEVEAGGVEVVVGVLVGEPAGGLAAQPAITATVIAASTAPRERRTTPVCAPLINASNEAIQPACP